MCPEERHILGVGGSVDKGHVFWVRECLGKGACCWSRRMSRWQGTGSSGGKCLGKGDLGGVSWGKRCSGEGRSVEWGGACPLDGGVPAL